MLFVMSCCHTVIPQKGVSFLWNKDVMVQETVCEFDSGLQLVLTPTLSRHEECPLRYGLGVFLMDTSRHDKQITAQRGSNGNYPESLQTPA